MSDDVDEVVRRLSTLPEAYVLQYFWTMIGHAVNRLDLLRQLGQVVIARPSSWDVHAIRRQHEQTPVPPSLRTACFICADTGALYRHHVLEVYHGGSNGPRNQVVLCFSCHKVLHPWLRDPVVRGFRSLADDLRDAATAR